MAYTIVDLLEKLAMIEEKGCNVYRNIAFMSTHNPKLKTIAGVLAKEEERHIEYYRNLKEEAKGLPDIEIDFDIYDKVSKLLQEFKSRIIIPHAGNERELLKFAVDFEKQNFALLVDIQGRLVRNEDEVRTKRYQVLSEIIKEEEKHVKNLEVYIKE